MSKHPPKHPPKRPPKKSTKKRRQKTKKATPAVLISPAVATPPAVVLPPPPEIVSHAPATPPQPTPALTRKMRGATGLAFMRLMRLDRPIGIFLLLWPTYWSLWLAAKGLPSWQNLLIFTLGAVLMRSAGCVINDYADRHIDGQVQRTRDRPLVAGLVSPTEALLLFAALCAFAFALVLMTNPLTIQLSLGGVLLAVVYPFMKRFTHMPQVVLGAAFAWSIPMAFAAETGTLIAAIWLVYVAVVVWALIYDTFYAMVDRDDDIRIGVKSTAILFGDADRAITALLQGLFLLAMLLVGRRFELGGYYYGSLCVAALLFAYQQWLIKHRLRENCFRAFLNNNYVGLAIFAGMVADYYFR